jgi:hypothetical protein
MVKINKTKKPLEEKQEDEEYEEIEEEEEEEEEEDDDSVDSVLEKPITATATKVKKPRTQKQIDAWTKALAARKVSQNNKATLNKVKKEEQETIKSLKAKVLELEMKNLNDIKTKYSKKLNKLEPVEIKKKNVKK